MSQEKLQKKINAGAPSIQKGAPQGQDEEIAVKADVSAINSLLEKKIVAAKKRRVRFVNLCHACGHLGHTEDPRWHDEDEIVKIVHPNRPTVVLYEGRAGDAPRERDTTARVPEVPYEKFEEV